jgi:predicted secreted protein
MAENDSITVKGKAGEPIDLPISDGPPTGYAWSLQLPAELTRIEDGALKVIAPERRLGSGATGAIRVIGPAGRYRIEARLARPWEPDKPARVVSIDLVVE